MLSIPDLLNGDVGDLRDYGGWSPGKPNSWNDDYASMVDIIFDQLAAEGPEGVLVMGDLFEAHWGLDSSKTGIFGPIQTSSQKRAAMHRAYRFYAGKWKSFFSSRGLTPYPGVGDHDILDNNWPIGSWKWRHMDDSKAEFARAFTRNPDGSYKFARRPKGTASEGTCYAVRLPSEADWNTLVITTDVWRKLKEANGAIKPDIGSAQLRWIKSEIAAARSAKPLCWVIVQAHTPVISPVRFFHSSNISYRRGKQSALWALLKDLEADLLLHGEVHDMTTRTSPLNSIPVQVVHGAIPCWGNTNYLRMAITDSRIDLNLKLFHGRYPEDKPRLWQTSPKRPPAHPDYDFEPPASAWWTTPSNITYGQRDGKTTFANSGGGDAGAMLLDKASGQTVMSGRTGRLAEWNP